MKNKIIGILVCILLIATAIPVTGTFLTLMPTASTTNANMKPIIGNRDANMENYTLPCWGRYPDIIFCKYGGLSSIQAVDLADEIGQPTGYCIYRWNYSSSFWDTYIVGITPSFMIYPDDILLYYGADTLPNCGSCISPNPTLYVWIEDPQSYLMDIYIYNTDNWTLIGQNLSVSNGSYSQLPTCFSEYDNWYNWSVNVTNSAGLWTNETIKFKTMEEPPSPPIIDGPLEGRVGRKYNYTFNATDPDGDNIYYYIDWGDNQTENWFGSYPSSEEVTVNHTWSEEGSYIIRAKARNIFGRESEWGTLTVIMPRNRLLIISLFLQFLDNHPHMFPILRYIRGLL